MSTTTRSASEVQTAQGLRTAFTEYFRDRPGREHLVLPSAPLVPHNDPTILLINAGMTPLKRYFTGQETPPSPRMVGVQKCIRTLDIEQVGRTPRHCTFFEMLGNFSIGDYFKEDVIPWAWTFLTDVLGIPTDRLMVTVHENDPEAYNIWLKKVGLPESKIVKLGDEDNFWFMADTGPCGPDSEIFYDLGPEFGSTNGEYDGPGSAYGRWIEIWNLVFTQFDRQSDGTLQELPKKNVDTGAGLERMCVVLQDKKTVFQTDGFVPLIEYFEGKTRNTVGESKVNPYYVLADHLRATSFLIADGVYPDRAGRGYVLRRIMRRALRWANRLGFAQGEWFGAFPILTGLMGTQYSEIVERGSFIADRVAAEEELFLKTLSRGETLLQKNLEDLRTEHGGALPAMFPGQLAFALQDTYGFPLDITKDVLEEHGLGVDEPAFNAALQEQRARSKADTLAKLGAALTTAEGGNVLAAFDKLPATVFTSYSGSMREETTILGALEHEGNLYIALEQTPFYAESGGQIGDKGTIASAGETPFLLQVHDTQKAAGGVVVHRCTFVDGDLESLQAGARVVAQVDIEFRVPTMRAHSSAHLLHSALKQVLGEHVEQAGSLVEPDRVRFDFKHFEAMSPDQIRQVDRLVNQWILQDCAVEKTEMPIADAKAAGAVALFGEKYGDTVRVVKMGDHSLELCGGTHLEHTSEIGAFVLIKEESIASGTRRVSGLTGFKAVEYFLQQEEAVQRVAAELRSKRELEEIMAGIARLKDESKALRDEIAAMRAQSARGQLGALLEGAERLGDTVLIAAQAPGASGDDLRTMATAIKDKAPSHAILLIGGEEGKYATLVMASPDQIAKGVKAGDLIGAVGKLLGAGGGGRPDMAQGGGKDGARIPEALALFVEQVRAKQ